MSGPGPSVFQLPELRKLRAAIDYEARQQNRQLSPEEVDQAAQMLMQDEQAQRDYGASPAALRAIHPRDQAQAERLARMAHGWAVQNATEGAGDTGDNPLTALALGGAQGLLNVGSAVTGGIGKLPVVGKPFRDISETLGATSRAIEPDVRTTMGALGATAGEMGGELYGYGKVLGPVTSMVSKAPIIGPALERAGGALASKFTSGAAQAAAEAAPTALAGAAAQNLLLAPDWKSGLDYTRPENLTNLALAGTGILHAAARGRAAEAASYDPTTTPEDLARIHESMGILDSYQPETPAGPTIEGDAARRALDVTMGTGLTPGRLEPTLPDNEMAMRNEAARRAFGISRPQVSAAPGVKGLAIREQRLARQQANAAQAAANVDQSLAERAGPPPEPPVPPAPAPVPTPPVSPVSGPPSAPAAPSVAAPEAIAAQTAKLRGEAPGSEATGASGAFPVRKLKATRKTAAPVAASPVVNDYVAKAFDDMRPDVKAERFGPDFAQKQWADLNPTEQRYVHKVAQTPVEAPASAPPGTRRAMVRNPDTGQLEEKVIVEPRATPPALEEGGAAPKAAGFRRKRRPKGA